MGAPLFAASGREILWDRLAAWSRNWTAAGFGAVHILGRSRQICDSAMSMAAVTSCEVRPPLSPEARAADYSTIGFLAPNELPDLPRKQDKPAMAPLFRKLGAGSSSFSLVFIRPEMCNHCPQSHAEVVAGIKAGTCHGNAFTGLTKVIGVPSRMQAVDLHSSADVCKVHAPPPYCSEYEACLLPSVPITGHLPKHPLHPQPR